jgi:hypothetical protein
MRNIRRDVYVGTFCNAKDTASIFLDRTEGRLATCQVIAGVRHCLYVNKLVTGSDHVKIIEAVLRDDEDEIWSILHNTSDVVVVDA